MEISHVYLCEWLFPVPILVLVLSLGLMRPMDTACHWSLLWEKDILGVCSVDTLPQYVTKGPSLKSVSSWDSNANY